MAGLEGGEAGEIFRDLTDYDTLVNIVVTMCQWRLMQGLIRFYLPLRMFIVLVVWNSFDYNKGKETKYTPPPVLQSRNYDGLNYQAVVAKLLGHIWI